MADVQARKDSELADTTCTHAESQEKHKEPSILKQFFFYFFVLACTTHTRGGSFGKCHQGRPYKDSQHPQHPLSQQTIAKSLPLQDVQGVTVSYGLQYPLARHSSSAIDRVIHPSLPSSSPGDRSRSDPEILFLVLQLFDFPQFSRFRVYFLLKRPLCILGVPFPHLKAGQADILSTFYSLEKIPSQDNPLL